jgi:hypothetical protein
VIFALYAGSVRGRRPDGGSGINMTIPRHLAGERMTKKGLESSGKIYFVPMELFESSGVFKNYVPSAN